jgi:hypothetical protein
MKNKKQFKEIKIGAGAWMLCIPPIVAIIVLLIV